MLLSGRNKNGVSEYMIMLFTFISSLYIAWLCSRNQEEDDTHDMLIELSSRFSTIGNDKVTDSSEGTAAAEAESIETADENDWRSRFTQIAREAAHKALTRQIARQIAQQMTVKLMSTAMNNALKQCENCETVSTSATMDTTEGERRSPSPPPLPLRGERVEGEEIEIGGLQNSPALLQEADTEIEGDVDAVEVEVEVEVDDVETSAPLSAQRHSGGGEGRSPPYNHTYPILRSAERNTAMVFDLVYYIMNHQIKDFDLTDVRKICKCYDIELAHMNIDQLSLKADSLDVFDIYRTKLCHLIRISKYICSEDQDQVLADFTQCRRYLSNKLKCDISGCITVSTLKVNNLPVYSSEMSKFPHTYYRHYVRLQRTDKKDLTEQNLRDIHKTLARLYTDPISKIMLVYESDARRPLMSVEIHVFFDNTNLLNSQQIMSNLINQLMSSDIHYAKAVFEYVWYERTPQ